MGKKLAEVRSWNPISQDVVRGAFAPVSPEGNQNPSPKEITSDEEQSSTSPVFSKEGTTFKQFRMSETDGLIVEKLLTSLRGNLGVKVTFTDLVHAMIFMVDQKRDDVRREAQTYNGKLQRPQLSDGPKMREFQKALATILLEGTTGKNRFI